MTRSRVCQLSGYLGLVGISSVEYVEVAGRDSERFKIRIHKLKIMDKYGKSYSLRLLGLDKITSNPGPSKIDKIQSFWNQGNQWPGMYQEPPPSTSWQQ